LIQFASSVIGDNAIKIGERQPASDTSFRVAFAAGTQLPCDVDSHSAAMLLWRNAMRGRGSEKHFELKKMNLSTEERPGAIGCPVLSEFLPERAGEPSLFAPRAEGGCPTADGHFGASCRSTYCRMPPFA
jgi:hypothetical protein